MKKNTMNIILIAIIVIAIACSMVMIIVDMPLFSFLGGIAVASTVILLMLYKEDSIEFGFLKYDEAVENDNMQTFHTMYDEYDKEVYIMCNNMVRHKSTGEDLYHGMSFEDCEAWCKNQGYTIIDNIW